MATGDAQGQGTTLLLLGACASTGRLEGGDLCWLSLGTAGEGHLSGIEIAPQEPLPEDGSSWHISFPNPLFLLYTSIPSLVLALVSPPFPPLPSQASPPTPFFLSCGAEIRAQA